MLDGRDDQGRFVKGEWKGGPGRATKRREEDYQTIFSDTITPEKFKASCQQVWLDSVGKRINTEGKLLDDPLSTPSTRVSAFARLANHVLGKPIQPVLVEDSAGSDILDSFMKMSPEERQVVLENASRAAKKIIAEYHLSKNDPEQLKASAQALPQENPDPIAKPY